MGPLSVWVFVKGTGISGRVGDTPLESFVLADTSHSTGRREAARAAESCLGRWEGGGHVGVPHVEFVYLGNTAQELIGSNVKEK